MTASVKKTSVVLLPVSSARTGRVRRKRSLVQTPAAILANRAFTVAECLPTEPSLTSLTSLKSNKTYKLVILDLILLVILFCNVLLWCLKHFFQILVLKSKFLSASYRDDV